MHPRKLARVALRSSLRHVKHVTPTRPRHATGLTAEVYRQVERDFGMLAPPVALHSPAPAVLAAAWAMLRESLVVTTSLVPRTTKEAVAAAVSQANSCPYCVEVHSAAIAGDLDPAQRAIAAWARAGVAARWPFPAPHAPQIIAVATAFHYLNRVVHVFLGDSPLPPELPAAMRDRAMSMVGRIMRVPAGTPGESLPLLETAPLPADLTWAAGEPHLAEAFARAAATIDAVPAVPSPVRELLTHELSTWDGSAPGMSRAWADVRGLPAADRAAGRLALLVAKAPYQVTDDDVEAYHRDHPADALVELVAWAALAAARHAGSRLATEGTAAAA